MTREEAIMVLKNEQPHCGKKALFPEEKKYEAYDVAIKALEQTRWNPVSERLPEKSGLFLITLENGDVCQCEFNPDFIDEEHENGAFTYYHQYFDGATLGMIDEEEEAVDAIAWMPFEPYEPQESEDKYEQN